MTVQNTFAALARQYPFNAALGGLVGLLAGDAIGVCYEFQPPERLPVRERIDMTPPAGFNRSHQGVPVGTWSDDGAQALCLLASLIERDRFSLNDFADRLVRWMHDGYMAVDGHVFDIGSQTADALHNLSDGVPPRESGGATESDNGNGSLMRVLPLALWHTGPDENLVHAAHLQSLPTHAHARSQVACAFYCLVARGYLRKFHEPWSWAGQRLQSIYEAWPDRQSARPLLAELAVLRAFPKTDRPRGSGYVIDTIWSAKRALEESSFEEVIRTAVLFGHDTDTTAAVAGGLAGIRFGLAGIPERWLAGLRGFELVAPLLAPLVRDASDSLSP
ncbi:ADP-ribosylglycohydrolase family protein [Paraburkholderia sp. MM5477-R1]|uniref:ADP-ribosylglycohydrolase family protein n=1 Tax=Paraburkholderia sp. MM5477-R1 TaxID=2991062 RepID=UPI003D1C9DDE